MITIDLERVKMVAQDMTNMIKDWREMSAMYLIDI